MGMKRRRFDYFKSQKKKKKKKQEQEQQQINHFILTKTTSFRFMLVRLIGRNKRRLGSVIA
jgi:hypothetical protein